MRFAFVVHPIAAGVDSLLTLDDGLLGRLWGSDPLGLIGHLHEPIQRAMAAPTETPSRDVRVVDQLTGLISATGVVAEGRLYEIPLDAVTILEERERALGYIEQAVNMAAQWGAKIVGLGSMTGIVGGRGMLIAEKSPIAVTTGNSLTAYTALQNVFEACDELGIDLARETVAVVGIPGSIASVAATLLAPHCGRMLLVGRRASAPAHRLCALLGCEFVTDMPRALGQAGVVLSATSTGSCIDQSWLKRGGLVIDVGVPTDIRGAAALRDDVLVLTGGLVRVPEAMAHESRLLWFQRGMIPSCLAETMLLALEERQECLSLGRDLNPDTVQEIGSVARAHGFDFSRLFSFGSALTDDAIVTFQKIRGRSGSNTTYGGNGKPRAASPPAPKELAVRASRLFARYINPVLMAMNGQSGLIKTFVRGEGTSLVDAEGNKFLDFVAGFGSLNLGHNHPAVAEAVSSALRDQAPGFTPTAINPYATALAERLVTLAPPGLEMVFFTNSGTESVEAAIKLARAATGRSGLVSCEGSFHGKTLGALSVTGNASYQKPFQPLVGDCESIPYGDIAALERALVRKRAAAFIVEPIQAEGGLRVPPDGYLRRAQDVCRSTGTLLIVDEVQTGLGRTGTMFAVEHEEVEPDVLTLAKSLGGGLVPIGAMLMRRTHWLKAYGTIPTCTLHTSTFGGGSLACSAGLAALSVLENEHLAESAARRGQKLMAGLTQLCGQFGCLREIRGRGLLMGVEFEPLPNAIKTHWQSFDPTGLARYVSPEMNPYLDAFHSLHAMHTLMQGHGIYTQFTRSNPLVLRIEPPLTLSDAQVDEFLAAFEKTCREIDFVTSLFCEMIAKTSLGKHDASQRATSFESA